MLTGFDNIDVCAVVLPPGAGTLEYLSTTEIDASEWEDAVRSDTWNHQKAVFAAGWHTMPYAGGSGAWTEDQAQSDQGDYFRLNITARLAADSPAVRGELSRMKRYRYVLRLTRNGQPILIGSLERPLRFSSRFDSGADAADTRGHAITFEGVSLEKSPGYIPVF